MFIVFYFASRDREAETNWCESCQNETILSSHQVFLVTQAGREEIKVRAPPTPQSSTEDLSAPLYLYPSSCNQSTADSNPPLQFLSDHSPSDQTFTHPDGNIDEEIEEHEKDGIQQIIEQLGLLGLVNKDETQDECCGIGSFYSKIVGVKGPKNDKEIERLDGWIEYYLKSGNEDDEDGGVKEPFRLVHLLIGKAVAIANEKDNDRGLGDLEFPSTVQDFLDHDPPTFH